ncbi:tyrosine-type recombinase/integrase [Nocardioides sp. GXZ039]|uniref:tyrosine-type recombinase/integrase n=1 Tax=Nocardioides sp. GXZ039 TaxID=3136018 RepID=UPI0030F3F41E
MIKKLPSGRWQARHRPVPGGKQVARNFDRKLDAVRWLDAQKAAVLTGTYADPGAGRITFREYATAWQAAQTHRPNTAAAVDSALRVHALPRFGDRPIASIRPTEVQAWVRDLSSTLAPSTVRVTYQHLRSVFRAAELDRVISRTPCEQVKLPRAARPRVTPLATEVVLGAAERMPDRWRALVTLMAGTGLRPGEAAGLCLEQVEMLRKTLHVDRQLLLRPRVLGPVKTESSDRFVPFGEVVAHALAAHMATYPPGEHGLVFTDVFGAPVNRDEVGRAFKAAAVASGGPATARLHDLRHYYASLLIRAGEDVKVVQDRLGHASARETLDTYSHLWPDSEDRTRSAVDGVLGARTEDSLRTEDGPR